MNRKKHILLYLLGLFALLFTQFAYSNSPGIPSPSFGLEAVPGKPSQWPSNSVAGYYYIEPSHSNASNSVQSDDATDPDGNRYGHPDRPRSTIPSSLSSGSYAMLSGSINSWPQRIDIEGTSDQPVWFVGDPDSPPTFFGGEIIFSGQYVIIDNLKLRNNARLTLRNKDGYYFRHHAGIRNIDALGTGEDIGNGSAIGVSGLSSSARTSEIVISNVNVSYYGKHDATAENDFHGIKPGSNVDNLWVLDSSVHHNGGDSIQIGDASISDDKRSSHIYISGNDFHSNYENDVDIKEADHIILSGNHFHDSGTSIVVHDNSADVWFINNHIFNSTQGANVTSGTNINFVGNLFYNIHTNDTSWSASSLYSNGAVAHFRGGVSGSMVSNTFYDFDTGLQIASITSLEIKNNMFLERATSNGYDINLGSSSLRSLVDFDYNLFFNPNLDTRINWATGSADDVSGVISLGTCDNCIEETTSPVQGASNYNFTLTGSTTALNNGTSSATYTLFSSEYNLAIDRDISGTTRVLSGTIDIGAYEGEGTSPPSPPVLSTQ